MTAWKEGSIRFTGVYEAMLDIMSRQVGAESATMNERVESAANTLGAKLTAALEAEVDDPDGPYLHGTNMAEHNAWVAARRAEGT